MIDSNLLSALSRTRLRSNKILEAAMAPYPPHREAQFSQCPMVRGIA